MNSIAKDKLMNYLIIVLILILFLFQYMDHSNKFFWLDEVTTYEISDMNTVIDLILRAKNESGQPFLFYFFGRVIQSVSLEPQIIRLLPFFCFILLLINFLKFFFKNRLALFLFIFYVVSIPFTYYVFVEYRPYSLSFLLFGLYLLLHFGEYYSRKYLIYEHINSLLLSLTLSLNIPFSLMLFIFSLYKYRRIIFRLNFLNYFIIFIIYFLYFINLKFVTSHANPISNINLEFFISSMVSNLEINYYSFYNQILVLILFILFLTNIYLKNYNVISFTSILFLYQIIFPTYILHNRIDWYSARYSHLIFFIIPLLLMKIRFMDFIRVSQKIQNIILLSIILYITYNIQHTLSNKNYPTDENSSSSLWVKLVENAICNDNLSIIANPFYIDRIGKYQNRIARNLVNFVDIRQTELLSKVKCLLIISGYSEANSLEAEIESLGFKKVKTEKYYKENPWVGIKYSSLFSRIN
jgi:hypothetical protein